MSPWSDPAPKYDSDTAKRQPLVVDFEVKVLDKMPLIRGSFSFRNKEND